MLESTRRALLAGAAMLSTTVAAAAAEDPMQDNKGGSILGPRDPERERQNFDLLTPPDTDHGSLPNLKFSFDDTHVKMREGGWSREVTQRELPIAKTIAGVNMRLTPGGVRELHWHKEGEWSFMLAGNARITAVDNNGYNFVADVTEGDTWFFPSGIPHSIQGPAAGTAPSSSWPSPTAAFPKTVPLQLRTYLRTCRATCWQRIS